MPPPVPPHLPASTLGQDKAYVLGHLLGLSEAELSELESEGLIGRFNLRPRPKETLDSLRSVPR